MRLEGMMKSREELQSGWFLVTLAKIPVVCTLNER